MVFKFVKKIDLGHLWLLILVWILIFTTPILSGNFEEGINWGHIFKVWEESIVVFVVFIVNRLILLPKLLFKGKHKIYMASAVFTIVALSCFVFIDRSPSSSISQSQRPLSGLIPGGAVTPTVSKQPESEQVTPVFKSKPLLRPGQVPGARARLEMGPGPRPRPEIDPRPGIGTDAESRFRPEIDPRPGIGTDAESRFREESGPRPDLKPMREPRRGNKMLPFSNVFIMSLLIIGFDTGLIFFKKWMKAEQNKIQIEKDSVETKMAFLKSQVSPHFFMNTLNNIHALVDISSEETKSTIIKLSKLMGYMLYESQNDKVDLKKEFEFVSSYVELMRLRYTEDVDIRFSFPSDLNGLKVPPLLTIAYIENAFKYGISYERNSYVHISYLMKGGDLLFEVENLQHQNSKNRGEQSGIGLVNSKKRLDLLYAKSYNLDIDTSNNIYCVKLNIPL